MHGAHDLSGELPKGTVAGLCSRWDMRRMHGTSAEGPRRWRARRSGGRVVRRVHDARNSRTNKWFVWGLTWLPCAVTSHEVAQSGSKWGERHRQSRPGTRFGTNSHARVVT